MVLSSSCRRKEERERERERERGREIKREEEGMQADAMAHALC
jgi:hypothetical protein